MLYRLYWVLLDQYLVHCPQPLVGELKIPRLKAGPGLMVKQRVMGIESKKILVNPENILESMKGQLQ